MLSAVQISSFGISCSLISKTEQISTLHCNKKNFFCHLLEETRVSLKKHYFLFLVHVDSCLFCGRSDTDIGRGSSAVASSRLISCFFFSSCFHCLLVSVLFSFFLVLFLVHLFSISSHEKNFFSFSFRLFFLCFSF